MANTYKCVITVEGIKEYIGDSKIVAFDYETAPDLPYLTEAKAALDPARAHLVGCSFSVSEGTGIYVPIAHQEGQNIHTREFLSFLKELLENTEIVKVAHNLPFEAMFSYKYGIVIQPPVYDTFLAAMLTNSGEMTFRTMKESGLKTMAPLVDENLPTFSDVTGGRNFDELHAQDPETIRYGAADSDISLRLYNVLNAWFDKFLPGHRYIAEQVESPAAIYTGIMKFNGVPVDEDLMHAKRELAQAELVRIKCEIEMIIGDVPIGANCATKAFKDYLYKTLKLPIMKTTMKGNETVDDESLILLSEHCKKEKPELVKLFDLVIEYRKWGKLMSTYLDGYLNYVNPVTGRIHPDLMQMATETGRFACRRPNLQNSPQPGADFVGVRNFITAPDGYLIMEADYSQAEIRIAAYLSQDEVLLSAYEEGADVHAITTSAIYDIPLSEAMDHSRPDYKHRRTVAKSTMFGIMYGIGGAGLARNLYTNAGIKLTADDCNEYIKSILSKYSGMAAWQIRQKKYGRDHKYVQTDLGRRRYLPDINSNSTGKANQAARMAINTPVQGLGADILKLAMGRLVVAIKGRDDIQPILTVHDSLVFLVKERSEEVAKEIIKTAMSTPPDLPDFSPLPADISIGKRYGELKEE